VQASCGEQCDDPSPGANCTPDCQFICDSVPQAGCRKPFIAQKASLLLKDKTPDKKDILVWKWLKGSATVLADFGDPLNTSSYALCLYDQSGGTQPRLPVTIPAGGSCRGKPCWKPTKKGFKYTDKDLTPDGALQLLLLPGADGVAKIIFKGKGANLGMPPLPPTTPVTVQLKRIDNPGVCWDADYTTPTKSLPDQFKARSD
jgi:hypothetical protein